jgi:GTP-binding protein
MLRPLPVVAIVGRPNVGKSTLFNRLIGARVAIVEDTPGITRDRIYGECEWQGRRFGLIDTGGILIETDDELRSMVREQAQFAVQEADLVIFAVDAVEGTAPGDQEIADLLRRSHRPVLVVAIKADNPQRELNAVEFAGLGFGEVQAVSALHGRGVGDMLDVLVDMLSIDQAPTEDVGQEPIAVALVGRPNVGKSSLLNAILGEPRAIVSQTPGTTRDAIDTRFSRGERDFLLIDTAGIRRRGKIQGSIEYYCVLRAEKAIGRADVALLVIDARDGLTDGDKRISGVIVDAGAGCVVVANKWDLALANAGSRRDSELKRAFAVEIAKQMPHLGFAAVAFTAAMTGYGVDAILDSAAQAADNRSLRVPTTDLNRVVQDAVSARPYQRAGRPLRVYYATMASVRPPTVVLFVNDPGLVHFSYLRYIENRLRERYGFAGTPIRLLTRQRRKRHDND